jgi:zinc transporter 9
MKEGKENVSTMHATSMAMLFSAGTFLYVATVHVLPEVTKDSQNGYSRKELFALVLGAILPLFLTAGHHH